MQRQRVIIIGGGFAGASAAVQLTRKIAQPLEIAIVEPGERIGVGLAYSTEDPGFRLNAPAQAHSIDVRDPLHFVRWCDEQGLIESDPDSLAPSGLPFIRRRDFGRYVEDSVREHSAMPNGTTITHIRARASDLSHDGGRVGVTLDNGTVLQGELAIIATGNPAPRRPAMLAAGLENHPAVRANPLIEGIDGIEREAHVLVTGAGLTALDMVAGLVQRGHRGKITVVSRRGLRPRPQPPAVLAPPVDPPVIPPVPIEIMYGPLPDYVTEAPLTAMRLLRGLRRSMEAEMAAGRGWHTAFDAVSLPLSRIWPRLPDAEKIRVLRHLRPFYDAFRFRTPPMTDAIVHRAERDGLVAYRTARILSISGGDGGVLQARLRLRDGTVSTEDYDALVNCTGLDSAGAVMANPLLASLAEAGALVPHPTRLGVRVDEQCRPLQSNGKAAPRLRVIGPPSAGGFGDPLGVFFISAQIDRVIPGMAEVLGGQAG